MNDNGCTMVSIIDSGYDEVYNILLNEKEIRFLDWLSEKKLLSEEVSYNLIESAAADFT